MQDAFAPPPNISDPAVGIRTASFLAYFGVVLAIWSLEAVRRCNALMPVQLSAVFSFFALRKGLGMIAPLYYFIHWVLTPIDSFKSTDMRLTQMHYTRAILPSLLMVYYLPLAQSYLLPENNQPRTWLQLWHLFPITHSLAQFVMSKVCKDTADHDKIHAPKRDVSTIRYTIGIPALISVIIWLGTVFTVPAPLSQIFLPQHIPSSFTDMHTSTTDVMQWNYLFAVSSTYLWLLYFAWDAKAAGMITQSWITLLAAAAVVTIVLGPGGAIGAGFLYREYIITEKRHRAALTVESVRKRALDEKKLCTVAIREKNQDQCCSALALVVIVPGGGDVAAGERCALVKFARILSNTRSTFFVADISAPISSCHYNITIFSLVCFIHCLRIVNIQNNSLFITTSLFAAPYRRTMSSNAVASPGNNRLARIVRAVPAEVWSQILSYVKEKGLKSVVVANFPRASQQAVRLIWKDVTPQNGKFELLYHKVEHNPQALANHIHSLIMTFEAPGEQLATCRLSFPCLQQLKVIHNKHHTNKFTNTHACIRTLISPALTHLEIGTPENEGSDCKPRVDNFFQALAQCPELHTLNIRAGVRGAARDFVQALRACGKLRNLTLDKHTGCLVNRSTIKAVASHPKLATLKIHKLIDMTLISTISTLDNPFRSLTSLDLSIEAGAATSFLCFTRQLRCFRLLVHGTESIFSAFPKLKLLEHLSLHFKDFALAGADYKQLVHLTHLKQLDLCGSEEHDPGLDTESVHGLSLAKVLGQLPLLELFRLHANNTFDDEFLVALGRGCPKLTSLAFSSAYELVDLRDEPGVVFPCLQRLEIGNVVTNLPWMDENAEDQLASNIARAVRAHAPNLKIFHATIEEPTLDDVLASKVERVWLQQMLDSFSSLLVYAKCSLLIAYPLFATLLARQRWVFVLTYHTLTHRSLLVLHVLSSFVSFMPVLLGSGFCRFIALPESDFSCPVVCAWELERLEEGSRVFLCNSALSHGDLDVGIGGFGSKGIMLVLLFLDIPGKTQPCYGI
ncbi:FAD/NAD(P)-binding domain-containing protein, partial [Aureobasidium melanogenum]